MRAVPRGGPLLRVEGEPAALLLHDVDGDLGSPCLAASVTTPGGPGPFGRVRLVPGGG